MKAIILNMRQLPADGRPEKSMDVLALVQNEGSRPRATQVGYSKKNNEFNSYDSFEPRGGANTVDAAVVAWCPLEELLVQIEGEWAT